MESGAHEVAVVARVASLSATVTHVQEEHRRTAALAEALRQECAATRANVSDLAMGQAGVASRQDAVEAALHTLRVTQIEPMVADVKRQERFANEMSRGVDALRVGVESLRTTTTSYQRSAAATHRRTAELQTAMALLEASPGVKSAAALEARVHALETAAAEARGKNLAISAGAALVGGGVMGLLGAWLKTKLGLG
jgi:hypothetical protein